MSELQHRLLDRLLDVGRMKQVHDDNVIQREMFKKSAECIKNFEYESASILIHKRNLLMAELNDLSVELTRTIQENNTLISILGHDESRFNALNQETASKVKHELEAKSSDLSVHWKAETLQLSESLRLSELEKDLQISNSKIMVHENDMKRLLQELLESRKAKELLEAKVVELGCELEGSVMKLRNSELAQSRLEEVVKLRESETAKSRLELDFEQRSRETAKVSCADVNECLLYAILEINQLISSLHLEQHVLTGRDGLLRQLVLDVARVHELSEQVISELHMKFQAATQSVAEAAKSAGKFLDAARNAEMLAAGANRSSESFEQQVVVYKQQLELAQEREKKLVAEVELERLRANKVLQDRARVDVLLEGCEKATSFFSSFLNTISVSSSKMLEGKGTEGKPSGARAHGSEDGGQSSLIAGSSTLLPGIGGSGCKRTTGVEMAGPEQKKLKQTTDLIVGDAAAAGGMGTPAAPMSAPAKVAKPLAEQCPLQLKKNKTSDLCRAATVAVGIAASKRPVDDEEKPSDSKRARADAGFGPADPADPVQTKATVTGVTVAATVSQGKAAAGEEAQKPQRAVAKASQVFPAKSLATAAASTKQTAQVSSTVASSNSSSGATAIQDSPLSVASPAETTSDGLVATTTKAPVTLVPQATAAASCAASKQIPSAVQSNTVSTTGAASLPVVPASTAAPAVAAQPSKTKTTASAATATNVDTAPKSLPAMLAATKDSAPESKQGAAAADSAKTKAAGPSTPALKASTPAPAARQGTAAAVIAASKQSPTPAAPAAVVAPKASHVSASGDRASAAGAIAEVQRSSTQATVSSTAASVVTGPKLMPTCNSAGLGISTCGGVASRSLPSVPPSPAATAAVVAVSKPLSAQGTTASAVGDVSGLDPAAAVFKKACIPAQAGASTASTAAIVAAEPKLKPAATMSAENKAAKADAVASAAAASVTVAASKSPQPFAMMTASSSVIPASTATPAAAEQSQAQGTAAAVTAAKGTNAKASPAVSTATHDTAPALGSKSKQGAAAADSAQTKAVAPASKTSSPAPTTHQATAAAVIAASKQSSAPAAAQAVSAIVAPTASCASATGDQTSAAGAIAEVQRSSARATAASVVTDPKLIPASNSVVDEAAAYPGAASKYIPPPPPPPPADAATAAVVAASKSLSAQGGTAAGDAASKVSYASAQKTTDQSSNVSRPTSAQATSATSGGQTEPITAPSDTVAFKERQETFASDAKVFQDTSSAAAAQPGAVSSPVSKCTAALSPARLAVGESSVRSSKKLSGATAAPTVGASTEGLPEAAAAGSPAAALTDERRPEEQRTPENVPAAAGDPAGSGSGRRSKRGRQQVASGGSGQGQGGRPGSESDAPGNAVIIDLTLGDD